MRQSEFIKMEAKINQLLHDISLAFDVPCSFFDHTGGKRGCCGFQNRSNFCRFIHFYDTQQICRQSYLQRFEETEYSREPLIYFCPFGLVNIVFPLISPGEDPFFATTGPLLYNTADDQMISNILTLNYLLKPRAREVRQLLGEVTVKSEITVMSMTTIIHNALKGVTPFKMEEISVREDSSKQMMDSIQLWLRANPYKDDAAIFHALVNKILPDPSRTDFTREELAGLFLSFNDYLFADRPLNTMVYRTLTYIELLFKIAKNNGMHLEQIFNTDKIDADKIINAASVENLRYEISQINDIFIRHYLQRNELHSRDIIFRAMHYIRNHYSNISLADVAAAVNLNPTYFSNCFKKATGQSYSTYLNKIRIEKSKQLLIEGDSIAEIAQQVGFSDQSYFTNVFKKIEGISPNRWKNAQEKMEVSYFDTME